MVHLSVAVGQFFEALFYALLRAGGIVAGWALLALLAVAALILLRRAIVRRRR